MLRAHKIRLNPTPEQAAYFVKAAGTARFVYNWGLEQWIARYQAGEKPSALGLKKQFNAIRRQSYPWTCDVTKSVVEGAFLHLGKAFKQFFDGCQAGRKVGYPQFKSRKRSKRSFYLANDRFTVGDHWIKLPHIGKVNMAESLRLVGKITNATVSQTAGHWYVSITVDAPDEPVEVHAGPAVGIDLGINRLVTVSDGRGFENQKPLKSLLRQVKRLNRQLSRKQPGSRNYEKARYQLARLHKRIRFLRDDYLHKLTTELTRTYSFIALEDLHVKGMVKNRKLALALSDAAFGRLVVLLKDKAARTGTTIVQVDRFFPSSKRCYQCGHIHDGLTLVDRVFVCPACGWACDRDLNASLNLLTEGLRLHGAT